MIQDIDIRVEGKRLDISVSIGVTTKLSNSFIEVVKLADKGLYTTKQSG